MPHRQSCELLGGLQHELKSGFVVIGKERVLRERRDIEELIEKKTQIATVEEMCGHGVCLCLR